MGRTELPQDSGMVFWMGERRLHQFWMKRTKIPLALIFVDYSKVVGIITLQPLDERRHGIDRPSSAVIETNAGWPEANGVAVGNTVEISMV
jgi:uncharacterized membrane protein (UPF0127 family)